MKKSLLLWTVLIAFAHIFTGCSKEVEDTATESIVVPDGFVYVKGATITGQITDSAGNNSRVFIDGRTVEIADFFMCDHEVTQGEYETYCDYNGSDSPSLSYGVGPDYPVYFVSWYDVLVYCNRRSIAEDLTPCYTIDGSTAPDDWGSSPSSWNGTWNAVICDFSANGYRLPTEAEWEYAARGGNGLTGYQYTYAGSDTIDDVAWYYGNASKTIHEVKQLQPNQLGLYDMSGNVSEWCWDWSSNIATDTPNTGVLSGISRVLHGSSYDLTDNDSYLYRSRSECSPEYSYNNLGFRLVRTVK